MSLTNQGIWKFTYKEALQGNTGLEEPAPQIKMLSVFKGGK